MINQRLFGSPISGKVKKKLEDRQKVAGEVAPGESIEAIFPNVEGNNQADLSSRTPFVRMWTSIKFIQPTGTIDKLEELTTSLTAEDFNKTEEEFLYQLEGIYLTDSVRETRPNAKIVKIENKYYIKYDMVRNQIDFARKIYEVGNHTYQQNYGSVDTNASLQNFESETNQTEETSTDAESIPGELFPQQLKNNPLFKPQAGITSITSETEGTLGVIKKTIVNFVVHNFEDFDKIYNKYFLKPGATIFVDFGWSSVKNLYKPIDLVNSSNIKEFLYGSKVTPGYEDEDNQESVEDNQETIGIINDNQGDLEVIQGIVTDYNAKVTTNGSIECSVTLTSANSALLGFETDDIISRQIQDTLTRGTLFLGIEPTVKDSGSPDDNDLNQFLVTPNKETSATDIETYNKNLDNLALIQLSSKNLTPSGNEIRTGVFVNSLEADDIYVSWGYIEDIIINQNFGFGNSGDDINEGNNLQVRIDSSNSFTTWNDIFIERQKTLSSVPEEPPLFLYPEWWGGSDPAADSSNEDGTVNGGSFSYFNKKYPKLFYELGEHSQTTDVDIEKKRIPIREVFINVEAVISAFSNENVKKVMKDLLTQINKDSDGIFDWKLISGETDSELIVIDNNRPDIQQRINDSGQSDSDSKQDRFENMFKFNIMSPNSIVKDYNLEFSLPAGNIGNMYAIQGMSHENKIFPLTNLFDEASAIDSLDSDSLSIIYEPDNGGYRAEQLDGLENKDGEYFDVFQNAQNLIDSNVYKTSAIRTSADLIETNKTLLSSDAVDDPNENPPAEPTAEEKQQALIKQNNDKLAFMGFRVVTSFKDYYRIKEIQEISLKNRPNLLPFTLSLTTYGIGSIVPGDTFRVDYLPQMHLDNTYLQTMKVTHNINSDGWYTSLDTQYRILPDTKSSHYVDIERDVVRLSPAILQNLNLSKFGVDKKGKNPIGHANIKVNMFIQYMTNIKIKTMDFNNINIVLSFNLTKDIDNDKKLGEKTMYHLDYLIKTTKAKAEEIENKYPGAYIPQSQATARMPDSIRYMYPPPTELKSEKSYYMFIRNDAFFILPTDRSDWEEVAREFDLPHHRDSDRKTTETIYYNVENFDS